MVLDDGPFRRIFRDSPIGMAILGQGGVYREVNPSFAELLGYSPEFFVGRSYSEVTHPADYERDHLQLAGLGRGELTYFDTTKRYLRKDGTVVWARITTTPVQSDGEDLFITQVEDITEVHLARELLERRSLYDPLTGMPNRALLLDRLDHALTVAKETGGTVACVFMDVDHFKLVNDTLGQDAGDVLLTEIAHRLHGAVRTGDTVSRYGGDEFVVVLEDVASRAAAEGLLAVMTAAVEAPVMIAGHEVVPTVSVGLAMAGHSDDPEGLLRDADIAMSVAKSTGRNRVEVFDVSMREVALNQLSIEAELRAALRSGELVVHYQPVVDIPSREIVAFEALVRWQHPQRGLLLPEQFIQACEQANLIVPLGSYVIHEACHFLLDHPEYTGRVYVNVSTRQIGAADLYRVVTQALHTTGVPAHRLSLEITESAALMASADSERDLVSLVDLGVDLIIDDFGTGYSTLSSVVSHPIAGLKLARDFTIGLGESDRGSRISAAMATLTAGLGLYGVIEGIETEEQYQAARDHGWALGQGYLFGRPVPASAISVDQDGTVTLAASESR